MIPQVTKAILCLMQKLLITLLQDIFMETAHPIYIPEKMLNTQLLILR